MKNLIQWLKSLVQKWDKSLVLTMVLFVMTIYLYYPDLINSILNVFRFSFYNPVSQMFMLPAIITIGIIFINLILTVLTLLEKFLNQKIERFVFSLLCLIQVVLSSVRGYSTTNSMGYLGIRQRSLLEYLSESFNEIVALNPWAISLFAYFLLSCLLLKITFRKVEVANDNNHPS